MNIFEMQRLVNSGQIWHLEGAMGREAMRLMEEGQLMLGREACRDYWGNRVPSRTEVKDGTKGSSGLVADSMGSEYAEKLSAIP